MDDKHPEVIAVELGGKSRRLKLGPAAFRLARIKHGVALSIADLQNISPDLLAQVVWIGLLPDEPDLSEEQVLLWMSADDEQEWAAVAGAMRALGRMTDGLSRALGSGSAENPTKRK